MKLVGSPSRWYRIGYKRTLQNNHAEAGPVSGGQVIFVNQQEIREVILEHGDLLEIGHGGPKVRFRVQADGKPCKPLRLMLHDAREVGGESGLVASTKLIHSDSLIESKNPEGIPLGEERLLELVRQMDTAQPQDLSRDVLAAVVTYRGGAPAKDDETLLVLHHNAANPPKQSIGQRMHVTARMLGLIGH